MGSTVAGVAALAIVVAIAAVFAPTRHFEFVSYDDFDFVVENPHVATGLTPANVRWAFAEPYIATGGPVTWLSHMLDVELFGLDAGAHHLVNVAIHTATSLVVFAVLWSATGAAPLAGIVAGLFAVHPLHVESVAWVSERKDLLSGAFWFVTIWAYLAYVRRPAAWRYGLVAISFVFGLLSKPMIATLPVALLLLDYWPLRRLSWENRRQNTRRILEKLPLLLLSLVSLALTFNAQRQIGAVADFERVSLTTRVANACVAYVAYIRKLFWPSDLAVFYPYRDAIPLQVWIGCAGALLAMTALALFAARRAPYITTGWLWFIVTLSPVSGIVQVGGHAMADRFTYVPLVGLFVIAAWGGNALLSRAGATRTVKAAVAAVAIAACALVARAQVWHWQNGISLWEHALRVTDDNGRAHANLGVALARTGDQRRAIEEYQKALTLEPAAPKTHNNLALVLAQQGQTSAAISHYNEAIRFDPGYANAHNNLANTLAESGRFEEALAHHQEAIRLDPANGLARANLAITLGQMDRLDQAIATMREALRLDPRQAEWHYVIGLMLLQQQNSREAIEQFSQALAIDPLHQKARAALDELKARPY
jgi:Flp pilus assembly protein TadD